MSYKDINNGFETHNVSGYRNSSRQFWNEVVSSLAVVYCITRARAVQRSTPLATLGNAQGVWCHLWGVPLQTLEHGLFIALHDGNLECFYIEIIKPSMRQHAVEVSGANPLMPHCVRWPLNAVSPSGCVPPGLESCANATICVRQSPRRRHIGPGNHLCPNTTLISHVVSI